MESAVTLQWKNTFTKFIRLLSLFLWLMPSLPLAQSAEQPQATTASCATAEVSNRHGWKIPGLSKARIKEAPHPALDPEMPDLLLEVLVPISPADYMTLVGNARGKIGMLEVFDEAVDVTSIQRFILNDHVFGYLVTATIAGNDSKDKRIHFGSVERIYYYDADGSGKFTVMQDAGSMEFRIVVPEWVKQSKKKASAPKGHR
jgi:hypothetical protein